MSLLDIVKSQGRGVIRQAGEFRLLLAFLKA